MKSLKKRGVNFPPSKPLTAKIRADSSAVLWNGTDLTFESLAAAETRENDQRDERREEEEDEDEEYSHKKRKGRSCLKLQIFMKSAAAAQPRLSASHASSHYHTASSLRYAPTATPWREKERRQPNETTSAAAS
ncbi:hypothetical protein F2P81_024629 [Scophthalmus maximus]|uniref:Uncharacterized protein n=1 Tax=Scophthalmus maximus TaxID=52904 RepID=A0A6A4RUP3_SCOMX|nr:hypothetical protein F2P81_024629 [Scophthalmus maximus]